jgi:hypothetical protein
VKVLKSYKKRLQKMTAAQKDANGNFKSNPEAEVAQAQLIQVQRDIISSSLKTAKLSLSPNGGVQLCFQAPASSKHNCSMGR